MGRSRCQITGDVGASRHRCVVRTPCPHLCIHSSRQIYFYREGSIYLSIYVSIKLYVYIVTYLSHKRFWPSIVILCPGVCCVFACALAYQLHLSQPTWCSCVSLAGAGLPAATSEPCHTWIRLGDDKLRPPLPQIRFR